MYTLIRVTSVWGIALSCFFAVLAMPPVAQKQASNQRWTCSDMLKHGQVPSFSIERKERGEGAHPSLLLNVSISETAALSEAHMVLLGCKLNADFPKENEIEAIIFDDRIAAKRLLLYGEHQENYGLYLWHLRGRYELHRSTKEQFVQYLTPTVKNRMMIPEVLRAEIALE